MAQESAAPAAAAAPGKVPSAPSPPPFMAEAVDRRLRALETRLALAEQALAEAAAIAEQVRACLPNAAVRGAELALRRNTVH